MNIPINPVSTIVSGLVLLFVFGFIGVLVDDVLRGLRHCSKCKKEKGKSFNPEHCKHCATRVWA